MTCQWTLQEKQKDKTPVRKATNEAFIFRFFSRYVCGFMYPIARGSVLLPFVPLYIVCIREIRAMTPQELRCV
jgi:hypothetical protein